MAIGQWVVFRNRGKSRANVAFSYLDVVFGSALAAKGLRHVNLEVQISWQAQHFVNLEKHFFGRRSTLSTSTLSTSRSLDL